jgi:hypothetical protein
VALLASHEPPLLKLVLVLLSLLTAHRPAAKCMAAAGAVPKLASLIRGGAGGAQVRRQGIKVLRMLQHGLALQQQQQVQQLRQQGAAVAEACASCGAAQRPRRAPGLAEPGPGQGPGQQEGGAARLYRCSSCMLTRYCSVECQRQHWPEHKRFCVCTNR